MESRETTEDMQITDFENEGNVPGVNLPIALHQYQCTECAYVYDEMHGDPSAQIVAGTVWDDVPADWVCPVCDAPKNKFDFLE